MKTSTKLLAIGIAALVVGIGGGIGIGYLINPNKTTFDLRYGGQYYPGEFLLKGEPELWTKYGVNVDHRIFASGGDNNDAMIAGELDVNCGSDSKTVGLFSSMDDALIIGTIQRGDRYSTIVRDGLDYTSWYDMVTNATQTVNCGIKFGTGAEQVVGRFLESVSDLDWDNFTWVELEVTQMVSALESEQIECFTAWEHTPSVAVSQGVGYRMMTYGSYAMTPASLHTTSAFAYANPQAIIAFLAGHLDKYEMITTEKTAAATSASGAAAEIGVDISVAAFEEIFETINFQVDFNETVIEAIEDTADFLLAQGKIEEVPDLVWDSRFVEAAMDLQANFGTPSTGLSIKSFNSAVMKVTEQYFGVPQLNSLLINLISCTFCTGIIAVSYKYFTKKE